MIVLSVFLHTKNPAPLRDWVLVICRLLLLDGAVEFVLDKQTFHHFIDGSVIADGHTLILRSEIHLGIASVFVICCA